MKTIEVRSLFTVEKKKIDIPYKLMETFNIWKNLRKESYNKNIELEEAFYAGYILANPIVNEECRKFKKQNRIK